MVEEYQSGKIALSGRGQEDIMVVAVLNWSTHPLDINVPPLHPFQMDPVDIVQMHKAHKGKKGSLKFSVFPTAKYVIGKISHF